MGSRLADADQVLCLSIAKGAVSRNVKGAPAPHYIFKTVATPPTELGVVVGLMLALIVEEG